MLGVDRNRGVHDSGKTSDHEHGDEPKGEKHGRVEANAPPPHGADPVEDLNSGRNGNEHRKNRESRGGNDSHPCGEHMVTPNGEPHKSDDGAREDD